jgi:pilus assembly protein CpaD
MINFTVENFKTKVGTALLIGAITTLGACAASMPTILPPDQNYKVTVAETGVRMELYVRPQGLNLSARDRAAMQSFVALYGAKGNGGFYLNVPSNTAGAPGMRQAQAEIQNILVSSGLAGAPLQTGQYPVAPNAPAPLVLSFRRLGIMPIPCGVGGDLSRTSNNQAYANFGCAQQSNFAAMIGDPRQLIEPYTVTPPNGARRTDGFDKYVKGQDPASIQPSRQERTAKNAIGQ